MTMRTVLATDIGAESGRVIAVHFDGQRLQTEEVYRFPNVPVMAHSTLYWDILRLWGDLQAGIHKAGQMDAIGVNTWGVDFALLDRHKRLVGNPVHYRDRRTDGMLDYVFSKVPRAEIFRQTGIQVLSLNSLYQLASLARNDDPALRSAAHFLTIPDLLYFWLTGVIVNEFTNTTTTQCYNPRTRDWTREILDMLGIPAGIFGPVTEPGQALGSYHGMPVVLAPHHDTACAVLGVPASGADFAYLSSGTWSLLGLELPEPLITDAALAANVTNEGGYGGTFRFLKNIMGLWLLQESRRHWATEGIEYSYEELLKLASEALPFRSLVDPDDGAFLAPGDMPSRLRAYCATTEQPIPETPGSLTRCIFESLALKYRHVLQQLVDLTGRRVETLYIVGGGSQNAILCQMTANATGCKVQTGPVEATALGNALVQLIALGELKSIAEGRALLRESIPMGIYEPREKAVWDSAYARFGTLLERA